MKFVVSLPIPGAENRERIWRKLVPSKVPLAPDVDFAELARRLEFAGGRIRNVVFKAAARTALRLDGERIATMEDLVAAAEEERSSNRARKVGFVA